MLDENKIKEIKEYYKTLGTPYKIETPEFSIAMGYFLMGVLQTYIYRTLSGEVFAKTIKIDSSNKYGVKTIRL
jgi:hypothetical protein